MVAPVGGLCGPGAGPGHHDRNRPGPPGLAEAGQAVSALRRHVFEYAALQVVPRVDRGERMNAGLLLYCKGLDYLGTRVHLDVDRLRALDPFADPEAVLRGLAAAASICAGEGPAADEDLLRRFRWLTAPRSTVVQPGPVHTGLTSDPDSEADRLMALLVLAVEAERPGRRDS